MGYPSQAGEALPGCCSWHPWLLPPITLVTHRLCTGGLSCQLWWVVGELPSWSPQCRDKSGTRWACQEWQRLNSCALHWWHSAQVQTPGLLCMLRIPTSLSLFLVVQEKRRLLLPDLSYLPPPVLTGQAGALSTPSSQEVLAGPGVARGPSAACLLVAHAMPASSSPPPPQMCFGVSALVIPN